MENCIKKIYPASALDTNLPYLGAVVINIPALETADYSKRSVDVKPKDGTSLHLKCIGGTFVNAQGVSLGDEMDITETSGPTSFKVSNTDCQVVINDKYNISYLADWNENKTIKDLDYFAENTANVLMYWFKGGDVSGMHCLFRAISCINAEGDLSNCTYNGTTSDAPCRLSAKLTGLPMFTIGCRGIFNMQNNKNWILDTELFVNCNFDQFNFRGSSGKGDIINIINSNLTYFDAIGASGFSGSVEACMEKMWTLGVRSRTNMQFSKPGGVTLNGNTNEQDLKIDITNNGIDVKDYFTETVIASYDGSNWTYPAAV